MLFKLAPAKSQDHFANETAAQRFDHRVIAQKYRQRKRPHPKTNVRIADLERFIVDRYGPTLPNDDAGTDDALIMLHHLAHRADPERRMRAWLRERAPSFSKPLINRLITKAMRKPLKWKADKLAKVIGLDYATRTRLGITTIGAIDFGKTKRETRRMEQDAARHRELRAAAGATPHAMSEARRSHGWRSGSVTAHITAASGRT